MSVEHRFYTRVGYVLTREEVRKVMRDEETDIDVLASTVAMEVGCCYWQFGDFVEGPDSLVFGPDLRTYHNEDPGTEGMEDGLISSDGHLLFDEVRACAEVVGRIGEKLRELGLEVGEPVVALCYDIC